jgi:hypothetical protein
MSPTICAMFHSDAHVKKLVRDYSHNLMTAQAIHGKKIAWAPKLPNHAVNRWIASTRMNYETMWQLTYALVLEYSVRFNKRHLLYSLIAEELAQNPIKDGALTPPPYVGPKVYWEATEYHGNPIQHVVSVYRAYYRGGHLAAATWTHRQKPHWITITEKP